MHKSFECSLEEARYDAEAYKAFRDDDIRLGDARSAKRWDKLYFEAVLRVQLYESMIKSFGGRVG